MAFLGTNPTISVPVTRIPLAAAQRHTSSKATCKGVTLRLVMFIDTCAIPYSSINHPMALVHFNVPGCMMVLPSASLRILPVNVPPSRLGRPFSLTSNAMALARRVLVVLRLKLTAIKKSRAPTTVQPVRAIRSSNGRVPKSGCLLGLANLSGIASYSPLLHTARFFLSGENAEAS